MTLREVVTVTRSSREIAERLARTIFQQRATTTDAELRFSEGELAGYLSIAAESGRLNWEVRRKARR